MYALGATLIHLLTGITPADLPQQDLRIQWSDRVSVDPQLIRWINVLTAPDLDQRFSSAAEAREALHHHRYPQHSLTKRSQPKGSRVQLKQSPQQLILKIPQPKRSFRDILKLGGDLLL
ncbi:MAG: serine/threonine protein kinase, partial [Coleofasciculus sp. C2-GNP5-27]